MANEFDTNMTNKGDENNGVNTLARREFIKKSILASGGIFVGMAVGEKLGMSELTVMSTSAQAASGDIEFDSGSVSGKAPLDDEETGSNFMTFITNLFS